MGIGVSVFLIAIGAILAFAVHVTTQGLDLSTIGVILMLVGAVGLFVDMVLLSGRRSYGRRPVVVDDRPVVASRPVGDAVVEERIVDDAPRVVTRRRVVRRHVY